MPFLNFFAEFLNDFETHFQNNFVFFIKNQNLKN
jgi:hypothetical protein